MIYCVDIDGTLCTNTNGDYAQAQPHPPIIAHVNALYRAGHQIILHTARGSTTGIDWRVATEQQLRGWGVQYHELRFGKPNADIFIDDKAIPVTQLAVQTAAPSTPQAPSNSGPAALQQAAYLDVTYSPARAPYTNYPFQLATWLRDHVYGRSGRLLDIGCGRGENLSACARLGFDVTGVDISRRSAELAPGVPIITGDLEREPLPVAAGTFDFVFSKSVIEHMRQPMRLLEAAAHALQPGGLVVIMTPSWAHTYWGPFYIDHTHVTPFTAPSLTDALTMAGFEAIRVSHFYQLPLLWRFPWLRPVAWTMAALPLPYRPYQRAPWTEKLNTLIRFSKEVMLLGVARKPFSTGS